MKKSKFTNDDVLASITPKHRNISSLQDVVSEKSLLTPLTELIYSGEVSDSKLASYCLQLLDVLYFCHRHRVHHNNLHAQLLFVDDAGRLKVTGFGSEAVAHSVFSAPELIKNQEYRGEKVDAWSCGIILHLMFTRSMPDPVKLHRGELAFSGEMADLIASLLSINPDNRCTLKEAARHPWLAVVQKEPKLTKTQVEIKELINAALPGRPDTVVEKMARRLANLNIDHREDLALLVSLFKSPRRLAIWLEEKSRLPAFASLRIARHLYKFL